MQGRQGRSTLVSLDGSPTMSISRIRPSTTANPTTARTWPGGPTTIPGPPLTTADRPSGANTDARLRKTSITCVAPCDRRAGKRAVTTAIGAKHDVGVEQRQQGVEVASAGGLEERIDDAFLNGEIGVRLWPRRVDAPSGPARQLTSSRRRPVDDRGDLLERDREDVVQARTRVARPGSASRARRGAPSRPSRRASTRPQATPSVRDHRLRQP